MLGFDIANMHAKFQDYSFTSAGDVVGALQSLNVSGDLTRDSLPSVGQHLL